MTGLLLTTFLNANSWAISPEEVLASVHENWAKIEDLQATITIVTQIPGMEEPLQQEGKYYYKAPDKIRIDITAPSEQITVISGSTMTMKTGDRINKINLAEMPGMPQTGATGMPDPEKWMEDYHARVTDTKDGVCIIEVIPREKNDLYSRMEMDVEYEKGIAKEMRIYDIDGNLQSTTNYEKYTLLTGGAYFASKATTETITSHGKAASLIEYYNIQANKGITDEVFRLE